jgi:murein DD-endopeptidase MepM/ murein hydrolase activator NlpD
MDLAAPHGTPIRAVGAGTVTQAGWVFGGYGISVVIDHGNSLYTHYGHASQATVSPGQQVTAGQTIALEGSTGDSTGPHLHFEVHQGWWNQIEPAGWLRDHGVDIGGC